MTARRLVPATIAMAVCLSGCPASDAGTALLTNETGRDDLSVVVKDAEGRPFIDRALDPAFRFDTQFPDRELQCLVAGDGSFEVRDSSGTVVVRHDFADRPVCEYDELEVSGDGDLVWRDEH
jgi:hypothetical protein